MKLILFFLTITVVCLILAPQLVLAEDPLNTACQGAASSSPVCQAQNQTTNPITGDGGIVNSIARILTIIVGMASVIMLILGGLAFVTSGGNSEQEARARRRVIYGIVGIAVAALSWTIISLILDRLLS